MSQPQSLNTAIQINTALMLMFVRPDNLFHMHTEMLGILSEGDQEQKPNFPSYWKLRYADHRNMTKRQLLAVHEGLFEAIAKSKLKLVSMPVCTRCLSPNITQTGFMRWNPESGGGWQLEQEIGAFNCEKCQADHGMTWQNYQKDGKGKYSPFMGDYFKGLKEK